MEVFSYKNAIKIPFLVSKSKDWRVEFDDNIGYMALPVDMTVKHIQSLQEEIKQYGYINLDDAAFIINIITQDGWPIEAETILTEEFQNPYLVFNFNYNKNTGECNKILDMVLCGLEENYILYKEE